MQRDLPLTGEAKDKFMAKITQLYKTPEPPEQDMKDYKAKLFRYKAGQGVRFLLYVGVVVGIVLGMWLFARNKTYAGYEVMASVERVDTLNTRYAEYNGKILKYSRDGISCVNLKNEAIWSQTYNMQNPILDICQNSVVVADYEGNEVYVFNEEGLQTQITTLLPIQQISISSQGVTALLLNDSSLSWIYLYDREGTQLIGTRCSLDETGHPLSISISSDGMKLAVSYLQIQSGLVNSCLVFYNFGDVGGNFVDKIVSSKVYENQIIPRIQYLGDSICAAVSEQGILFYEVPESAYIQPLPHDKGHFDGETILLTSNHTFSSASSFANAFKEADCGMIIGEETGGMNVTFGDMMYWTMPVSGIVTTISYKRFWFMHSDENDIHGAIPHISTTAGNALETAITQFKRK